MQRLETVIYNGCIRLRIDSKGQRDGVRMSYLAEQYYKLPLQVMTPFYQDSDGTVSLYLLNPSGGMLGSDHFFVDVKVEDHARAHLLVPSATKIYRRTSEEAATQKNIFVVGENSTLEYFPEEVIPFKDSFFKQDTIFYLKKSSRLIAWDIMAAGRTARGEMFDFYQYSSSVKIYVEQELLLIDRMKLCPSQVEIGSLLCMRDYFFIATIYAFSEQECTEELVQKLREQTNHDTELQMGVSSSESGLIVVKVLEKHMNLLQRRLCTIWGILRSGMLHKDIIITRKY